MQAERAMPWCGAFSVSCRFRRVKWAHDEPEHELVYSCIISRAVLVSETRPHARSAKSTSAIKPYET
jgi:hypothetical protein